MADAHADAHDDDDDEGEEGDAPVLAVPKSAKPLVKSLTTSTKSLVYTFRLIPLVGHRPRKD